MNSIKFVEIRHPHISTLTVTITTGPQ